MSYLAIDLFCGLGGWTEGLLAEGYDVVGFDIERHQYGNHKYPAQLVLQDVLTIHGKQFKDAALIVASPPCQKYSYMAMPWSRAKAIEAEYRAGTRCVKELNALFDACFRIQREACEAAGRHIPMVVENVRGAENWVGRARWNFGSFYLWGDVPALMPIAVPRKVAGFRFDGSDGRKVGGMSWSNYGSPDYKPQGFNTTAAQRYLQEQEGIKCGDRNLFRSSGGHKWSPHWTNPKEDGVKQGGSWFGDSTPGALRSFHSKSNSRKAASAMIAKIPLVLARHIAATYKPRSACA